MSGDATFAAAARDVSAAFAELRRRGPALGLDPGRVALWGKSAGASLVLLAGLAAGRPPIGAGPVLPVSAIVAMCPPVRFDAMDVQLRASPCGEKATAHDAADGPVSKWLGAPLRSRRDLVAEASLLTYVTPPAPPVLVQAGSTDCMVPHQQSLMLVHALRRASAHVRLDIVPGDKHIDPIFDRFANLSVVVAFLEKALLPTAHPVTFKPE